MKKIIALLLAVMMVVSLCACGSTSTATTTTTTTTEAAPAAEAAPEQTVVKIGYIGDLTGQTSIWGQYGQYGAELAVKDINEKGGLLNGTVKLELVPMDGKGEAADSVNAFKKLVTEEGIVASVGTNFSSCNIPMAAVADEVKVPIIGTAASNELVTVDESGNLHPYSFRMCFLDSYIGTAIGNFAVEEGYKTAAIFTIAGNTNSEAVGTYIKEAYEAVGGQVVAEEQAAQEGDLEFRAQLGKIKSANPDVIFVVMNSYAMISAFATQAREMEINAALVGHDGWDSQELIDGNTDGVLDGCYFVSRIGFGDPKAAEFGERVNKEYNLSSSAETECLFGYDGVSWIAQCIERAGSADPTAIRDALESTDVFQGYIGTLVMDAATHNPTMACMLFSFDGTTRISVKEIAAA